MQAYAMLSNEEKKKTLRFVSFHSVSEAIHFLVPKPQNTPSEVSLQKKVKTFGRALQDSLKTITYLTVEY